jgi:hypothetical protein
VAAAILGAGNGTTPVLILLLKALRHGRECLLVGPHAFSSYLLTNKFISCHSSNYRQFHDRISDTNIKQTEYFLTSQIYPIIFFYCHQFHHETKMDMEKGDCCEMDEKTGVLQLYTKLTDKGSCQILSQCVAQAAVNRALNSK